MKHPNCFAFVSSLCAGGGPSPYSQSAMVFDPSLYQMGGVDDPTRRPCAHRESDRISARMIRIQSGLGFSQD
jgi:hypothetical protein